MEKTEKQLVTPVVNEYCSEEQLVEMGFVKTTESATYYEGFFRQEDRCFILVKKEGSGYLVISIQFE